MKKAVLLGILLLLSVGGIKAQSMPRQVPDSVVKEWELFYLQVFGAHVDLSQVKVPDNDSSRLQFVQYMIKDLSYEVVHEKEKAMFFGCLGAPGYLDYDTAWVSKIDMEFEQRRTDETYAIWHSGLPTEADTTYDQQKIASLWSLQIKCMTRLEGGVFNLFMNWKYKMPIVDLTRLTCWAGSRLLGFNSGQPCVYPETGREFHKRDALGLGSVLYTGYYEYPACVFFSSGCCPDKVTGVVMRPRLVISLK